jgi:hypothetical protein
MKNPLGHLPNVGKDKLGMNVSAVTAQLGWIGQAYQVEVGFKTGLMCCFF